MRKCKNILLVVMLTITITMVIPFGMVVKAGSIGEIAIDPAHFPDDNLRQAVQLEADGHGFGNALSADEIAAFTYLSADNVSDTAGIELLTGLTNLNLRGDFWDIDLASNTKLVKCDFSFVNYSVKLDENNSFTLPFKKDSSYEKLRLENVSRNGKTFFVGDEFEYDNEHKIIYDAGMGFYRTIALHIDCYKENLAKVCTIKQITDKEYTGKPIEPEISVQGLENFPDKDTDYTVTYSDNIAVGYGKAIATGIGNYYRGTITSSFKILPRQVTNAIVSGRNGNKITISWDGQEEASGYDVYMHTTQQAEWKLVTSVSDNKAVVSVPKDKKNICYFKIIAYTNVGDEKFYGRESISFSEDSGVYAPNKPQIVGHSNRIGQAYIGWEKDNSADGFELHVRKTGGKYKLVSDVPVNTKNGVYLFKLNKGKSYDFKVVAYRNVKGKKIYSDEAVKTMKISSAKAKFKGGKYNSGSVYGPRLSNAKLKQVKKKVEYFYNYYIDPTMSDATKVKMANYYLCENCKYAPTWAKNDANTAWGALVYKEAQCSGYARAMVALCDGMGIKCKYIHASNKSSNPNHQFNMVKVSGKWYIVDTQCNATSGFDAVLLTSSSTYKKLGIRWDEKKFPKCNKDYNWDKNN